MAGSWLQLWLAAGTHMHCQPAVGSCPQVVGLCRRRGSCSEGNWPAGMYRTGGSTHNALHRGRIQLQGVGSSRKAEVPFQRQPPSPNEVGPSTLRV